MNDLFRRLAPALALGLPLVALAQPASIDAAQPSASVAQLKYPSAFTDYKPWRDIKPGDWRAFNYGLKGSTSLTPVAAAGLPRRLRLRSNR
jgi:hypothetical protein